MGSPVEELREQLRRQRERQAAQVETAPVERAAVPEGEMLDVGPLSELPVTVPTATLTGAVGSWLAVTFALAYVVGPALVAAVGLGGMAIFGFWPQFPAFVLMAIAATAGVAIAKPKVTLNAPSRDPVLAATAGGLGMWFLLQNALLTPLAWLDAGAAAALVLLNVVEMTLLGTMFASFTKRPLSAMMLGAGFQLGTFVLSLLILLAVL